MHSEQLTQNAIEVLEKLVAFDSVSRNSNLPLIEWVEQYLDALGIHHERAASPDGKKSNLLARIGPVATGGIVLSGHTDVVPIDGQSWDTDPFMLTKKGDKLYGRGASDMKAFIAVCLALVPHFKSLPLAKGSGLPWRALPARAYEKNKCADARICGHWRTDAYAGGHRP